MLRPALRCLALSWPEWDRVMGRRSYIQTEGGAGEEPGGRASRAVPCPWQAPSRKQIFLFSVNPGEDSQWPQLLILWAYRMGIGKSRLPFTLTSFL